MKALVTGGAGFIGSNIAMELDKEHEVTVLDNFSNATEKNLEGFTGKRIKGSIVDFDWEKLDVDVVFHEAAISDTRVMDENLMMQTNVEAFRKMLEWASENNVKVIYAEKGKNRYVLDWRSVLRPDSRSGRERQKLEKKC